MVPPTGLLSRLLSTSTTFELSLWLPKTPADFHLKYSLQLDHEVLVI